MYLAMSSSRIRKLEEDDKEFNSDNFKQPGEEEDWDDQPRNRSISLMSPAHERIPINQFTSPEFRRQPLPQQRRSASVISNSRSNSNTRSISSMRNNHDFQSVRVHHLFLSHSPRSLTTK
jgi:hypothetical protein